MWRHRPGDDEFREEIEAHVALETDRLIAEGLTPDAAATAARRKFGNATQVRERYYESRRVMWLDDLIQDARFTFRSLRRAPGFMAVAVLTLAIGLGANTAIFSVVNAVLLRPLPYANPDRLVLVEHPSLSGIPEPATSAWRARSRTLEAFAGFADPAAATVLMRREPQQVEVAEATTTFFPLLGVSAPVGRTFNSADEASAAAVAVVSHRFWLHHLGGDPAAIGQTLTVTDVAGSTPLMIVGVLPEDFRYPAADPVEHEPLFATTQPDIIRLPRPGAWLKVVGRLSPGSTPETATVELAGMFQQAMQSRFIPSFFTQESLKATSLKERLVGDARYRLLVLSCAVGCVLLVVCANVANLLLARMSSRQSEFAVRAALGARTSRLVRLVLTESLLLAALGSVAALLLAYWTNGVVRSMLADRVSYVDRVGVDWWVLAFNVTLASAVGVVSGLASAMGVRSGQLTAAFTQGGNRSVTGRSRLRQMLLAVEIAVTFVLVVGAGLLCKTLWNLYHSNRGYDGNRVVTVSVMPNMAGTIRQIQGLTSAFFEDLTQRVGALPGVESAAAATNVPFGGGGMGMSGVSLVGDPSAASRPDDGGSVTVAAVTPGYFATIGATLAAGRDFGRLDTDGRERVAIVNEAFRRRIAPGHALVGAQIQFGRHQLTVIAIANDLPDTSLRQPGKAFVYLPLAQVLGTEFAFGRLTILARTRGRDSVSFVPTLRQAIWARGQDIVIDESTTMRERLAASIRKERASAFLFGLLAAIGLAVAIAGVYGVVAYSVARRTREIGIRIALGAARQQVVGEIVRDSARAVAVGIALGLAGALMATRAIASILFETRPNDPLTVAAVSLVLASTALTAAWIPARHAARIDPVTALRAE
jgi:predicted permease